MGKIPSDNDITFYLCTYYDDNLLRLCLSHLREHYSSRVIVVSDGDSRLKIPEICKKYSVEFYMGKWLYGLKHGGQRHHRMLDLFFKDPSSHLIKIDTDTKVLRRFKSLPSHFCNFGSVEYRFREKFVQGGCIGYPYDVAKKLYQDKVFLGDFKTEDWNLNAMSQIAGGKISEDQVNGYCVRQIDCPFYDHPEIKCFGTQESRLEPKGWHEKDFAVIHPCLLWKDIKLL